MKKLISVLLAAVIFMSLVPTAFATPSKGDVDGDGKVTSSDALLVLRYAVGQVKTIDKTKADLNKDGNINSSDALTILRICVGSLPAFDVPSTKNDIVSFYNNALKSTYYKNSLTLTYTHIDAGVSNDLTAQKSEPYNDKTTKTKTYNKGIDKSNGNKVEDVNPGITLEASGVTSATIKAIENGCYLIKITIKEEKTDISKVPKYNAQAALPFIGLAQSGTATYTGTTLELTVDGNGDATALKIKMPYVCEYKSGSHNIKDSGSVDYTATYKF